MSAEFIIENHALIQCKGNEETGILTIPDGVEKIMTRAFVKCSCEEIVIPPNVKILEGYAFMECPRLERVTIPATVKTMKSGLFYGCRFLEEVTISEGITEIPSGMFEGCVNLKTVRLPESLKIINTDVFQHCRSLEEINIPENVISIGSNAFLVCDSLKTVRFPKSLAFMGADAFGGCHALKRVKMPEYTGFIGKGAFQQDNVLYFPQPEGEMAIRLEYQWCEQKDEHLLLQFINTRDFCYREKIFSVLKTYSYKISVALFMTEYHPEQKIYPAYVRRNIKRIMENLIRESDIDGIEKVLAFGYVTKKNIDGLIDFAINHQKHEAYLTLLNYKNEVIGYTKKSFRL